MTPRTTHPSGERPEAEASSFEQAIERLQTIVEELEAGALSLEDSIRRYEEGVGLAKRLTQVLEEAEKRIERLVERGPGPPTTAPLDLDDEGGTPREPGRPGARDSASRGATPRAAEGRRAGRERSPKEPGPQGGGMEELPF